MIDHSYGCEVKWQVYMNCRAVTVTQALMVNCLSCLIAFNFILQALHTNMNISFFVSILRMLFFISFFVLHIWESFKGFRAIKCAFYS